MKCRPGIHYTDTHKALVWRYTNVQYFADGTKAWEEAEVVLTRVSRRVKPVLHPRPCK
jgi:hypothetical protein